MYILQQITCWKLSKPTDCHNLLQRHSKQPVVKEEYTGCSTAWGKRICSKATDFEICSNKLREPTQKRSYTHKDIKIHIQRVNTVSRETALTQVQRAQNTRMVFVTTYNRTNPNIQSISIKHWNLLQIAPKWTEVFSQPPMIALKRNKNPGNLFGIKISK